MSKKKSVQIRTVRQWVGRPPDRAFVAIEFDKLDVGAIVFLEDERGAFLPWKKTKADFSREHLGEFLLSREASPEAKKHGQSIEFAIPPVWVHYVCPCKITLTHEGFDRIKS